MSASATVGRVTTDAVPTAPPVATRNPIVRSHHGDDVVDAYEWLRDKEDPEVIAHLEAENAYTEAAHRAPRAAAAEDLRRDQGPHPGDRPVGADPPRRLVVLRAHASRASSTASSAAPRRRTRRLDAAGARRGRRRRRASRSCSTTTSRPRATSSSRSAASTSPPTAPGCPTASTSTATSGTRCACSDLRTGELLRRRDRRTRRRRRPWSPTAVHRLHDGRRRLAARHRVAARARHGRRGRRAGLPRTRRAVLGRRRASPAATRTS